VRERPTELADFGPFNSVIYSLEDPFADSIHPGLTLLLFISHSFYYIIAFSFIKVENHIPKNEIWNVYLYKITMMFGYLQLIQKKGVTMATCEELAARLVYLNTELRSIKVSKNPGLQEEIQQQIVDVKGQQAQQHCIPQFSGNSFVGAGIASSGNMTVEVIVDTDGRIYYNYSLLGGQPSAWIEIPDAPATDAAPAVALTGNDHNYMFVLIKTAGTPGHFLLNQGGLGQELVGWR
jgi:hypothetical protein